MKDSKNLVIGMLCAVVCIMAVAYAAFSTTLTINGTATISSEWKVAFENPIPDCELDPAENATTGVAASVNRVSDTVATVSMTFTQPGDKATCTIDVVNSGTLDALLNFDTTGTKDSQLVKFTLTGTDAANAPLNKEGGRHKVTVVGEFLDVKVEGTEDSVEITDDNKTATLSIVLDATQKLS